MNRFIYSSLCYLATPLLIVRLLWRSLRAPAYRRRWSERFGFYGQRSESASVTLAFHAVSVGEVHAAVPLIKRLLEKHPQARILVTTSTPTGSQRVKVLLGDRVSHVYLPYDYPGAVRRFLQHFSPPVLVIMETELWPNLIHACSQAHVRIVLANARLSEKSRRSYTRIQGMAGDMLSALAVAAVQSEHDAGRLRTLGLPADRIKVTGSMKFDMDIDQAQLNKADLDRKAFDGRPVLVAASTRVLEGEAEELKVLAAFRDLLVSHPDLLLVLVPRHPERFNEVFDMAVKAGFQVARRSSEGMAERGHQLLLGDSMGEMHYYLGLADIAYVGGSLVATGCQNIIEPAALGLPVVTGPSLYNFQAASEQLLDAGGMQVVSDERELATVVRELLDDAEKRLAMGNAAKAVVQENQGATGRNLEIIEQLLE